MKIKRILACVCASMLMALSFTACGDSDKKSDKSSSEVVTEAPTEAATEAETTADSSSAADSNAGGTNGQVNAIVVEDSIVLKTATLILPLQTADMSAIIGEQTPIH